MLTDADNRIDLSTMKDHPWFRGEPFGDFTSGQFSRSVPDSCLTNCFSVASLYVPPPLSDIDFNGSPAPLNTTKPFDFSAFFSSPGLSILRPTPRPQALLKREEEDYWSGMTYVPPADAFDEEIDNDSRISPAIIANAPATVRKQSKVDLSFKTPLRPSSQSTLRSLYSPAFPLNSTPGRAVMSPFPPTSSTRAKRMLSDVEAWKEMQDHAFEVGMTAKKTLSRPSRLNLQRLEETAEQSGGMEELERRRRKLGVEMERLEQRYSLALGSLV